MGLNLFNKYVMVVYVTYDLIIIFFYKSNFCLSSIYIRKPEKGVCYLIQRGFLENSPQGVARFLISRKGLSKQMIGEYLGNLQNPFNMEVLE